MKFSKARKVVVTAVAAAAGVLAMGAVGTPALAATSPVHHEAAHTVQYDPRCGCQPTPAPDKPAPAPAKPAPAKPTKPAKPAPSPAPSKPSTGSVTCPAVVPQNPTGADYVNAWNLSGTCLGAGAAGLVSSAWAGAIPSIIQGASGALG
ncbi:hypothetical protein [Amycolatopsis pithecellobii]|uniref:hypothetical protein n=1 Tax=Amycolatopsis pithecellobii TaxID=664692 RepID=UPI001FEC49BF|nr:hypothetical protein [Amycolatopsis pithecellobii]